MDAVSYTKRCGDVDLALNVFFDRNNSINGEDYYNIWNINADYSTKGHNLYLGFYYNIDEGIDNNFNLSNNKQMRVEFGSSGKLSNNNDKVKYDLGLVYSSTDNTTIKNGNVDDESGILGHVAVKYDDQKQLTAKLSYTWADDEVRANINDSVENSNRYHDGDETVFEDLYLVNMARNGAQNFRFYNVKDIKLELGYTLKNNDKHSFRLAYDYVQNDKDDVGNPFYDNNGGAYMKDVKVNVITLEYTYKLAENTRLRLGFQNIKCQGDGAQGDNTIKLDDAKANLYYTEIYSRF
jgi:hypothetical protein